MTHEEMQAEYWRLIALGASPLTSVPEATYLCDLARSPDLPRGHILEVGSSFGGTLRLIGMANAERGIGELVCSADPVPDDQDNAFHVASIALTLAASCRRQPRALWFMGTAQDLQALGLGRVFRMIFVDACHEYAPMLRDAASAVKLALHDGVVCFHDVHARCPGCQEAWAKITSDGGIPDDGGLWVPELELVDSIGTLRWRPE